MFFCIIKTKMSKTLLELLTYENPVLRNYAFWAALLIIKVGLLSLLTGIQRAITKVITIYTILIKC